MVLGWLRDKNIVLFGTAQDGVFIGAADNTTTKENGSVFFDTFALSTQIYGIMNKKDAAVPCLFK
jgi:hypothetical protein